MKIIAFDLDDVLCERPVEHQDGGPKKYQRCSPILNMIKIVNKCYDEGHYIKIFTSRGMGHFNYNENKIINELFQITKDQLSDWGVKHHELIMCKPEYDLLIDDKALNEFDISSEYDIYDFLDENISSQPRSNSYGKFLTRYCEFCEYKTIVEIGVKKGVTTRLLIRAAQKTGGKVFGYDLFDPQGVYSDSSVASRQRVNYTLSTKCGLDKGLYKLTMADTLSDEFDEKLKNDTGGKIDFAFIDGDHSYEGIKNDFLKVYPYLSPGGSIVLDDTYTHVGCRKFILELRKELNDGTFDILNLPYRDGLTMIIKRDYINSASGIRNFDFDKDLKAGDIYADEKEWYSSQTQGSEE
jgi:predicted O-methyltransferase YrrM|tara:strand:- start:23410 stop:24468 length:1059 start_codon:yes stop_codon:yes gene_type:complete